MQHFLRNLDYATALPLAAQVEYQPGQIASKTLIQNTAVGMTLFAFDKGEEISAHTSTGDAFVLALDGQAQVNISGQATPIKAGEAIVMPAGQPHSVSALECFKMLLVVVFPTEIQ